MKMKYEISQSFETLGDPCSEIFASREEAEAAAEKLRAAIAEEVAGWKIPDDADIRQTGYLSEIEAWEHAADLAEAEGNGGTYGLAAGAYIAEQAVEIEEIDEIEDEADE